MKKMFLGIVMLLILSLALTGCFQKDDYQQVVLQKGDVAIKLDFSTLTHVISRVTVIATNPSYDPITQDLAINGKIASGVISGLAEGSWNIRLEIYDDLLNMIYFGESNIMVTAGTMMNCDFVFEETPIPDETGSVSINLVIKDFPGHTLITQNVDQVVQGPMNKHFYVLDIANQKILDYDPMNYTVMQQFFVPEVPSMIALSPDETRIWVVFTSGHIGAIDTMSGQLTIHFSEWYSVEDLLCFQDTLVIRQSCPGIASIFTSLDLMDGTFNDTFNMPYVDMNISPMAYNPAVGRIYFSTGDGISQNQVHSFSYDPATGLFGAPHSVDSSFGTNVGPLRFIRGNMFLLTPNGYQFKCDVDEMIDLSLQSSLPYHYTDLVVDPMSPKMFLIEEYPTVPDPLSVPLFVLDQDYFFHWDTITLEGQPKQIFMNTDSTMTILVANEGAWYFKRVTWPQI